VSIDRMLKETQPAIVVMDGVRSLQSLARPTATGSSTRRCAG
jgi:hypothetical protein